MCKLIMEVIVIWQANVTEKVSPRYYHAANA